MEFSAFNQFYWFPLRCWLLSLRLRDHWKVFKMMWREYFNPVEIVDAWDKWNSTSFLSFSLFFLSLFHLVGVCFSKKKKKKNFAEIEISFIVHLAHVLCTSANRVYDTVILPKTLRFNAFIASSGCCHCEASDSERTKSSSQTDEGRRMLCSMDINNKQSKF